jgi:hypothetical protein
MDGDDHLSGGGLGLRPLDELDLARPRAQLREADHRR